MWTPLGKHRRYMNHQWEQREHVIGSRVYVLMYTNMRTYFRLLIHCLFMCMSVTTCMRVHACKFHVCVRHCACLSPPPPSPPHASLSHNTCAVHLCSFCGWGYNTRVTDVETRDELLARPCSDWIDSGTGERPAPKGQRSPRITNK